MSTSATSKKTKNAQPVVPAAPRKQTAVKKQIAQKNGKTKIVVKCDCGFANALFIRGQGVPGLNWEHGIQMKCTKADEWVWETDKPFKHAEFKILLNDQEFEAGENHNLSCGKSCSIKPSF